MSNVAELFVTLQVGGAADFDGEVRALPSGVRLADVDILVALDRDGYRSLLVPVEEEHVSTDMRSRGVVVRERSLEISGEPRRFAALECRDQRLNLVFERLVDDVLERVQESDSSPAPILIEALHEWRDLLRTAGEPIDRMTALGLHGELHLLELMSDRPDVVLTAWIGPERRAHDFALGERALEVKATASVDGNTISVSNLDQLDPGLVDELHLVVVHLRESPAGPSLDDRIRRLLELGYPRTELLAAVENEGYVFESPGGEGHRYEVRGVRVWLVDSKFPGLRRSDLAVSRLRGVSRVKYELALDVAKAPMPETAGMAFIRGWTG